MSRHTVACVVAAAFVIVTASALAARTSSQPSVNPDIGQLWVTSGDRAVVLDEQGARRTDLELGFNPLPPVRSADGRYLAVASLGKYRSTAPTFLPGLYSGPVGIRADPRGGSSTITLFDADTLRQVGRQSVRFRPEYYRFTDDGQRLVVISRGEFSNKRQEMTPPAVTVLDVPSAAIRFQSDIENLKNLSEPWLSPAGLLHILSYSSTFVSIDTLTGAMTRTPLPSRGSRWYETERVDVRYLELDDSVVTVGARGEVTAGPFPTGMRKRYFSPLPASRRFLLVSDAREHDEQLVVIENGAMSRRLTLLDIEPPKYSPLQFLFDEESSRLVVVGEKQGVIVDVERVAEIGRVSLPQHRSDSLSLDPGAKHLYLPGHYGSGVSFVNLADGHVTHLNLKPEPRYIPVDGRSLLALNGRRVKILDADSGRVLIDKQFPDSVVQWEPSLGLIFVRNVSGTTAYRPVPFDAVKNFGPDSGPSKQAGGLIFNRRGRRFLLTTAKGSRVYDYELNQVADLEGITADGLFVVEQTMGR